jgi:hypothetical protein
LLILLNGPRSVHLRSISRAIIDQQKNWSFKDYTVKYKNNGFIVLDSNQNNVYCNNPELGNLNHDIFISCFTQEEFDEKSLLIDEINDFNNKIDEDIKKNHFIDSWPVTDFSFLFDHDFNFEQDETYEKILETYRNSSDTDDIWTGRFSISFIEKLKSDIGSENLKIINFIRNPSSCAFTNHLDENCKIEHANISILNMFLVSKLPETINVKYEEFLNDKKFSLDGLEIHLPELIVNHNGLISEYEFSKYDSDLINDEIINKLNDVYSNFNLVEVMKDGLSVDNTSEIYNEFFTNLQQRIKEDIKQSIPENFFVELNYSPLSLEQIISK